MKYHYIGDGAGVIGLPHEITDEDAERDGLTDLLAAALDNGSYVAVETATNNRPSTARRVRRTAQDGDIESEVNDG